MEVKKATYYGYSLHVTSGKAWDVMYSLGFRPNGLNDSKGQFVLVTPRNSAWFDICERRKNCKVGDEFIITIEANFEKYL